MQQWLNLFLQIALPALKTLVYSGTSNLLANLQDELDDSQKKQTQLMLENLGVARGVGGKEDTVEIISPTHELVTNATSSLIRAGLDFQQQLFQQEKEKQEQMIAQRRDELLKLAAYQRETTLLLPEVQQTFEHWPLRLLPRQILENNKDTQPIPLRILLASPQLKNDFFDKINLTQEQSVERTLNQNLRQFLSEYYPLYNPIRPTEFLGGAWKHENFHGESSIKALFWMLKSQPTLILESEIEGNYLNFRIAYWGIGQAKYFYGTIFQFPYQDFLNDSAKSRAIKWKKNKEKLANIGKNEEAINRLAGENLANLAILEEEEELKAAGIDIKDINLPYKINHQDLESLLSFLSLCHCIVAGLITDINYLIQADIPPLLPEILPNLTRHYQEGEESLSTAVNITLSVYQNLLQILAHNRPYWLPELALKLAEALTHLPDKSLALRQVNYSLQIWLQQHQLPLVQNIQDLSISFPLDNQDRNYLQSLQDCLNNLGEKQGAIQVKALLHQEQQYEQIARRSVNSISVNSAIIFGSFTSDGAELISLSDRKVIELWSLRNKKIKVRQKISNISGEICALAVSYKGGIIAASEKNSQRSNIKIWNLEHGTLLKTLFGHKKQICCLHISPDGQTLISGSHKIKLWNFKKGESFQTLFGHKEWVTGLDITHNGEILVSGSCDKTLRIWQVNTGELIKTLSGHQGTIKRVILSPDETKIVSASADKTIKLWNLRDGSLLQTFCGHSAEVNTVILSPNGKYLISGSEDGTIKIWHLETLKCCQTLEEHSGGITTLAISADGQTLISSGRDNTVKFWQILASTS